MHCKNYVEYIIDKNEMIYIDTSTLMNVEALRIFIGRTEKIFASRNRQIIVTKSVFLELKRHLFSDYAEKRKKAEEVLEILEQFNSMFFVECEEDDNGFADSELLARLILMKTSYSQVLITNDKKLSKDAYVINNQESNLGNKIMVCHINHAGLLNMCCCVKELSPCNDEGKCIDSDVEDKKREIVYVQVRPEKKWYEGWKGYGLLFASGITGGVLIDKYAIPLIKNSFKVA